MVIEPRAALRMLPARRVLITLGLLALYRLGFHVALPGVDVSGIGSRASERVDLEHLSIFALGIHPYIGAMVLIESLRYFIPGWRTRQDAPGHTERLTYQLTLGLCLLQGFGVALYLRSLERSTSGLISLSADSEALPVVIAVTLAAGTFAVLWIAKLITSYGVCEGELLIYSADLVISVTRKVSKSVHPGDYAEGMTAINLLLISIMLFGVVFIAYRVQRSERRLAVTGSAEPVILRLPTGPLWAPAFVSSLMAVPSTLAVWSKQSRHLAHALFSNAWLYDSVYAIGIILVAFLMARARFDARRLAEETASRGAKFVDLVDGEDPAPFLERTHARISVAYSLYIAAVCILPNVILRAFGVDSLIGGFSLLLLTRAGVLVAEATLERAEPAAVDAAVA